LIYGLRIFEQCIADELEDFFFSLRRFHPVEDVDAPYLSNHRRGIEIKHSQRYQGYRRVTGIQRSEFTRPHTMPDQLDHTPRDRNEVRSDNSLHAPVSCHHQSLK
jgi:hypothetical protein